MEAQTLTANTEVRNEWEALELSGEYTIEALCAHIAEEVEPGNNYKLELDQSEESAFGVVVLSWDGELEIEAFDVVIEENAIPEDFGYYFQIKDGELQLDEEYT